MVFIYPRHIWEFPKFTNSKFGNIYPQFKAFFVDLYSNGSSSEVKWQKLYKKLKSHKGE